MSIYFSKRKFCYTLRQIYLYKIKFNPKNPKTYLLIYEEHLTMVVVIIIKKKVLNFIILARLNLKYLLYLLITAIKSKSYDTPDFSFRIVENGLLSNNKAIWDTSLCSFVLLLH